MLRGTQQKLVPKRTVSLLGTFEWAAGVPVSGPQKFCSILHVYVLLRIFLGEDP